MSAKLRCARWSASAPANGEAFAWRFTADGYAVALLARGPELTRQLADELPRAKAYPCDVAGQTSVDAAFANIRANLGDIDVLIFNQGRRPGNVEELMAGTCSAPGSIHLACLSLLAIRCRGQGRRIVVGSTASRAARADFARGGYRERDHGCPGPVGNAAHTVFSMPPSTKQVEPTL